MSWAEKLYNTYCTCASEVGNGAQNKMLLPVFHLTQKAQIEVVLTENGDFVTASEIDQEEAVTVMPVTEDSASRSSGIAPHPLHDKLIYVARDYHSYVEKDNAAYVNMYLDNLYEWVVSASSHATIKAVYGYLLKGTLMKDLIDTSVLTLDNGKLDKKRKVQKTIVQSDALVRFYVQKDILSDHIDIERPWKDKSLYESYITFEKQRHQDLDICNLSGEITYCTEKHPAKIRHSGDKAKLISSNDSSGFTFRGRFATKTDAVAMGYETSQKIHNALRWLICKQGYQSDGMTILVWNAQNIAIPNGLEEFGDDDDVVIDTELEYAKKINSVLQGYQKKIDAREDVMIIELEAATEGRLSITYYQELEASDYFAHIEEWYAYCNWMFYTKRGKELLTPVAKQIVRTAFGILRTEGIKVDEKVSTMHLRHLLPCIYNGKRIPKDIMNGLFYQTMTLSKLDRKHWVRSIQMLCALMRKDLYDHNKGKERVVTWSMSLEENQKNGLNTPAYLCGKLLAVYDAIEGYDQYLQGSKHQALDDRSTNAMKLYAQFRQYPKRTLSILDVLVRPYVIRLGSKCQYYLRVKEEITEELMTITDLSVLKNLDYDFAMGFDIQRLAFERQRQKNKVNTTTEGTENE